MKQSEALGLKVALITPTVPHGLGDDLAAMADAMQRRGRRSGKARPGCSYANGSGCSVTFGRWK